MSLTSPQQTVDRIVAVPDAVKDYYSAQNPLHTFPRNFSVVREAAKLAASLTTEKLRGNVCNGFWALYSPSGTLTTIQSTVCLV